MTKTNWYKDWFNSPFYHKLYFERDEKEAELLSRKLIDHLKPRPEAGCWIVACRKGQYQ